MNARHLIFASQTGTFIVACYLVVSSYTVEISVYHFVALLSIIAIILCLIKKTIVKVHQQQNEADSQIFKK